MEHKGALAIILAQCLFFWLQYLVIKTKKESNFMTDQAQKKDIKDLKEVVSFGFALEKAGVAIFAGGFHPDKLGELLPVYQTAIPAFENIGDVPSELADLDAEEIAELSAMLISQGALNEHVTQIIDKSLKVAVAAYELIKTIKG